MIGSLQGFHVLSGDQAVPNQTSEFIVVRHFSPSGCTAGGATIYPCSPPLVETGRVFPNHVGHMPEIWFRNPGGYIEQLISTGTTDVVFDRGYTVKRNIDPRAFMDVWMPPHLSHWRVLHVGDQGSAAYNIHSKKPYAVYPTWQYGQDPMELLIWMIENPAGEDPEPYTVDDAPIDTIPVLGQEHIVVLTDLPSAISQRAFYEMIRRLQDDHPEVRLMIHGLYAFKMLLSLEFGLFDYDPRANASGGSLKLPSGRTMDWRDASKHAVEVRAVGFSPSDLSEPKTRCEFMIRSLQYGAANWGQAGMGSSIASADEDVDTETPDASWKPNVIKRIPPRAELPTDMIACDICSLASSCYVYRAESVCTLPRSSGSELAKFFKTKDSGLITQGLMELMDINATRLEKGLDWEDAEEDLSPEVSKLVNSLFRQGVDLAKLVDPKLSRPLVAIQNNVGAAVATASSPQQLVAAARAELEAGGIAPEDITFEMVESYQRTGVIPVKQLPTPDEIIEAHVVVAEDDE